MPQNNEREAVRNLQRYLKQLSYTEDTILSPPVDGIFDDSTANALIAFQRLHSLPENGVADKATWDKLYAEYLLSLERNTPPMRLDIFPRTPDDYFMSLGDEYFLVGIIQLLLNELTIIYDAFVPLVISGIFDEATEANIAEFQSKNLLEPTGRLDKKTWNRLIEAYDNYAKDYIK